jgi:NAD-dependent SIR2 family protein deacetylase
MQSFQVSPANRIPEEVVSHGGKLVICNLQKTPLDSIATIRIFAKTDVLMEKVSKI